MSRTYVNDGMALKGSFALMRKADGHSFARSCFCICRVHAYVFVYMIFAYLLLINRHSLTWHVAMFIHASSLIGVFSTFMHIIMIKYNVPHIRASMC